MAAEKKKGLIAFKLFTKKLKKYLHLAKRLDIFRGIEREGVEAAKEGVPRDVKEGHFAVIAKNEEEKPIRFVVELCVLEHPEFLRLLKMAEEEYGFQYRGVVEVPCKPQELRRILRDKIH